MRISFAVSIRLIAGMIVFGAMACSQESSGNMCTDGQHRKCQCGTLGAQGVQRCAADNSQWEPCECEMETDTATFAEPQSGSDTATAVISTDTGSAPLVSTDSGQSIESGTETVLETGTGTDTIDYTETDSQTHSVPDTDTGTGTDTMLLTDSDTTCNGSICDANAICADNAGTFKCVCNDGWMGSGVECSNVDECTAGLSQCDTEHGVCVDTEGGYYCTCEDGWALSLDGKTCVDHFVAAEISAGYDHACAMTPERYVVCWGATGWNPDKVLKDARYAVFGNGEYHAMAISETGKVVPFIGRSAADYYETNSPPHPETVVQISGGQRYTCVLRIDQSVYCWGRPDDVGIEDWPDEKFVQISSGINHVCGIKTDGKVVCWGSNSDGQCDAPDDTFIQIDASMNVTQPHTCGVTSENKVKCWGNAAYGKLDAPDIEFKYIDAGPHESCGIKMDDTVLCWGETMSVPAPDGKFLSLASTASFIYGIAEDGHITMWRREILATAVPPVTPL
ncbi:MAG: hypothetical protein JXR76_12445 [Deltaproteobacteria bacterium]|nr:hypothetical protein [Deltaproteobacteria bacterium]